MWNELVPHPGVVDNIQDRYLERKESQPHTRIPQSRVPVPGR